MGISVLPGSRHHNVRAIDRNRGAQPVRGLLHFTLEDIRRHGAGRRIQFVDVGGTTFVRHAELEQAGIPILAGIYGTNPAGGGYQAISPTILIAHKDANIAVGGAGIVSGMSPQGGFDVAGLEQLIAVTRTMTEKPPGSAPE